MAVYNPNETIIFWERMEVISQNILVVFVSLKTWEGNIISKLIGHQPVALQNYKK